MCASEFTKAHRLLARHGKAQSNFAPSQLETVPDR